MITSFSQSLLLGLVATSSAHFVLQIPTSIGYNDGEETVGPCDTFDPHDRSSVTDWPVDGDSIGLLTTHPSVNWEINVALLSDLKWMPLVEKFGQTSGVGEVCFSNIPGFSAWIGQPVVLQLIQHASDGDLYQCAAIQFVAGGPRAVPSDCSNSSGVRFGPIIHAPPPSGGLWTSQPPVLSSSSPLPSSSPGPSNPPGPGTVSSRAPTSTSPSSTDTGKSTATPLSGTTPPSSTSTNGSNVLSGGSASKHTNSRGPSISAITTTSSPGTSTWSYTSSAPPTIATGGNNRVSIDSDGILLAAGLVALALAV